MTEREKVLLQREAIKRFVTDDGRFTWEGMSDLRLRRLFPLPPEKVPNVVTGAPGWLYRQDPDGSIEYTGGGPWRKRFDPPEEAAIRAVIAEPYRLVSEEDGET